MAAPAGDALSRAAAIKRGIGRFATALFGLLAIYALAGWIGSSIPRNGGWRESPAEAPHVEILIESNGVHTAIVMPAVTAEKDWRATFPASDLAAPDRAYTHVAVSWGEREVFLETPTWADLSPLTVLRIVTVGGEGVLHVAHYVRPAPADAIRRLRLSPADYARLVRAIEARIAPPSPARRRYRGYDDYDVFYDAPGRYTPIMTCNQWTSDVLAAAGLRTGWWTPFAGGVMKWVPPVGGE